MMRSRMVRVVGRCEYEAREYVRWIWRRTFGWWGGEAQSLRMLRAHNVCACLRTCKAANTPNEPDV